MKSILIFDYKARRDPLQEHFYAHLHKHYRVFHSSDLDKPAEETIEELYGSNTPDYILWGLKPYGSAMAQSAEFINDHGISVIISCGDLPMFCTKPRYTENFFPIKTIKYVIARCEDNEYTKSYTQALRDFMDKGWIAHDITEERYGSLPQTFLRDAEILHVPWGIDTELYRTPRYSGRSIDLSFMCSIIPHNPSHELRAKIRNMLRTFKKLKTVTDNVFGAEYDRVLRKSKIFIAETGRSGVLTQKYLQAGILGCLIMGEIPYQAQSDFKHGETMISIENWDMLPNIIEAYVYDKDEQRKISERCRKMILEKYNMDKSIEKFREVIK